MINEKNSSFQALRDIYASRCEPENMRTLTTFVWDSLLVFTLVGVLLVFAYGTWEFFGVVQSLSTPQGSTSKSPVALDRAKLESVLSSIQDRASQHDAARSRVTPADPSR